MRLRESTTQRLKNYIRAIIREEKRRLGEASSNSEIKDMAVDLIDYLGGELPSSNWSRNPRIMGYFRELGYKDNDPMVHKIYNLALKLNRE